MAMYPKIGLRLLTLMISELIPIAGNKIIYTSGWPRNQNKCWNRMGLPPSFGNIFPLIAISLRKKLVPKFLSNNNKIAPDNNTGKLNTPNTAVKNRAQMVNGNLVMLIPFVRRFNIVL